MLSVAFILAFTVLLIGIVLVFYFRNKQLKSVQQEYVTQLENRIEKNKQQITIRHKNLETYNFLIYNLDDALIVQEDINVCGFKL
ncbi:hypothetical protein [Marixanthomonas ophiurae]|uniref:Uncharacterized protein n=1 Tax=Marixanthomonas ophiurae TaxID=387659 RepID=A0A3E1QC83_9FLAO|nr:hypothetical protein [Marixanthomonas ophiurae]RFN59747.1 hypothetical protein DZ858_06750 [Marixanthomonas ophiurae]